MAEVHIFALFETVDPVAKAVARLHALGVGDDQITVMSGIPFKPSIFGRPHIHSPLSRIALIGALFGLALAAFLSVGIFLLYPIIQGGQPLVPIPPSLIILFEVTMLGTMYATFFGMLGLNRFPILRKQVYDPRITNALIGIEIHTDTEHLDDVEKALTDAGGYALQREGVVPGKVDHTTRNFWLGVLGGGLVSIVILGLFVYDILRIPFPSNMVDQNSIAYEQGPRLSAPDESIPIQGPVLIAGQPASAPLAATADTLQRGKVLFSFTCRICHGAGGTGNGPLNTYFTPRPADLTGSAVQSLSDNDLFLVITQGSGTMPQLHENLTVDERWDVIGFVRTLKK